MPAVNDVYRHYDTFLNNPAIKKLANIAKWTISDKNKRPISLHSLFYDCKITGAKFTLPSDMMTLPELIETFCNKFPNENIMSNFAFYLDVIMDDHVILDIEACCKPDILKKMITLPYLYGERSMSNKGYHLVFPSPENLLQYPNAAQKPALKYGKDYELLLNHWITFTGRPLVHSSNLNSISTLSLENIYENLAANVKSDFRSAKKLNKNIIQKDISTIPDADQIIEILCKDINMPCITPAQYNNDLSRYEFGYFSIKYRQLHGLLRNNMFHKNNHDYTPEEKILILYNVATKQLPYRDKHNTYRNGMPWLLYEASEFVSKREAEEKT